VAALPSPCGRWPRPLCGGGIGGAPVGFGSSSGASRRIPVAAEQPTSCELAAGEKQPVTLGDRQVEALGEVDEELAARARAARLDEAEVLGGEVRVQRQLHLRQSPLSAPEADELTDGLRDPFGLDATAATVAPGRIGAITSDVTKSDPLHRR
jgi:hypothetical protein